MEQILIRRLNPRPPVNRPQREQVNDASTNFTLPRADLLALRALAAQRGVSLASLLRTGVGAVLTDAEVRRNGGGGHASGQGSARRPRGGGRAARTFPHSSRPRA